MQEIVYDMCISMSVIHFEKVFAPAFLLWSVILFYVRFLRNWYTVQTGVQNGAENIKTVKLHVVKEQRNAKRLS